MPTNLSIAITLIAMNIPTIVLVWFATVQREKSGKPIHPALAATQIMQLMMIVGVILICWQM